MVARVTRRKASTQGWKVAACYFPTGGDGASDPYPTANPVGVLSEGVATCTPASTSTRAAMAVVSPTIWRLVKSVAGEKDAKGRSVVGPRRRMTALVLRPRSQQ